MSKPLKLVITGALLFTVGLAIALGGMVLETLRSFQAVADSGTPSPAQLSEGIRSAWIAAMIGSPLALVGLCLAFAGIFIYLAQKK